MASANLPAQRAHARCGDRLHILEVQGVMLKERLRKLLTLAYQAEAVLRLAIPHVCPGADEDQLNAAGDALPAALKLLEDVICGLQNESDAEVSNG